MKDISQSLIDASTVIKVMKEKSSNKSNEGIYEIEMCARALRQISNEILDWVKEARQ